MQLVQPDSNTFDLEAIRGQLGDDWPAVNREIGRQLHSDVALVNSVSQYIINSGGKRLRPLLVLLAARACGYPGDQHIRAAAIIEFIHTATLYCTTMSSMRPTCVAGRTRRTACSATRPACWSATSCTRVRSS